MLFFDTTGASRSCLKHLRTTSSCLSHIPCELFTFLRHLPCDMLMLETAPVRHARFGHISRATCPCLRHLPCDMFMHTLMSMLDCTVSIFCSWFAGARGLVDNVSCTRVLWSMSCTNGVAEVSCTRVSWTMFPGLCPAEDFIG
jgi:hypothetical protein